MGCVRSFIGSRARSKVYVSSQRDFIGFVQTFSRKAYKVHRIAVEARKVEYNRPPTREEK